MGIKSTTGYKVLRDLRRYESRNVTFIDPEGDWPIVWDRARGMYVWDVDGKRYLDLTAAFGVAAGGHAPREVTRAASAQLKHLTHAMGDVHPHEGKARLVRALSQWTFERWTRTRGGDGRKEHGKTLLCNSGFEAVEAALKTAHLATGRAEVVAFEGAYHGLGYGALSVTHRAHFRQPFSEQLRKFGHFLPFPETDTELQALMPQLERLMAQRPIGAVLTEPIQTRAGVRVPPIGFLEQLREVCDRHGSMLILDEIYTGFGRTGRWFACEHASVTPDLVCLGKALTGGFPLSACVGRAQVMDNAWPSSEGEAIHTSTFLGHPVGCAMALAQLELLRAKRLNQAASRVGRYFLEGLRRFCAASEGTLHARGCGLLLGVAFRRADGGPDAVRCLRWVKCLLHLGILVLPEGEHGEVLGFSPPLIMTTTQVDQVMRSLRRCLSMEGQR